MFLRLLYHYADMISTNVSIISLLKECLISTYAIKSPIKYSRMTMLISYINLLDLFLFQKMLSCFFFSNFPLSFYLIFCLYNCVSMCVCVCLTPAHTSCTLKVTCGDTQSIVWKYVPLWVNAFLPFINQKTECFVNILSWHTFCLLVKSCLYYLNILKKWPCRF